MKKISHFLNLIYSHFLNRKVQYLFEKRLKSKVSLVNWIEENISTKKEMNMFGKWLDQLREDKILRYLQKDHTILSIITNQTEPMWQIAIKINPYLIQYVKNPTKELLKQAIRKEAEVLRFVNNQTEDLCRFAINQNALVIRYVKNQTKELCKLAIERDCFSIKHIQEQTVDLCIYALKQRKKTYKYVRIVPNPDFETTLNNLKEKQSILNVLK